MAIPVLRTEWLALALAVGVAGTAARGQAPGPSPENAPADSAPPGLNAPGSPGHEGTNIPGSPSQAPPGVDTPGSPWQEPAAGGRGGGMMGAVWDPAVGRSVPRASYRATWFTPQPVSGQATDLGYERQELSVSFPCWQDGRCDEWSAHASVRNELFQTHAILPDTHQPFPDELWNVRVGTTYRHLFDNGWIAGGTVSVGSASDRPFNSIDEMTAGVSGFLRIPSGERNAWLLSLSYSPTGELPFPVPGVAYIWQPTDDFRANIGLPLAVWWRPVDDLTIDLSYMLLTTVHARATYHVWRPLRVYAAYSSENEGYFLADRPDTNDRFYDADQRVTGGAVLALGRHASVDLSGGYVFDHHFFQGKNITSGTSFDRVDVGAGPFVALQAQLRW